MPKMRLTAHAQKQYEERTEPSDFIISEDGRIEHKRYGSTSLSPEEKHALLACTNKVPVCFGGQLVVINPISAVEEKSLVECVKEQAQNIFGFGAWE